LESGEDRLLIEEVESGGPGSPCSPHVQEVLTAPHSPGSVLLSAPHSPVALDEEYLIRPAPEYHKPERPSDLSFSNQSRRQGFVFNQNWNLGQSQF
jgi:hypothetical protein